MDGGRLLPPLSAMGNGYVLIVKNLPQLGNGQNIRWLANSVASMMGECARNAKRFLTT